MSRCFGAQSDDIDLTAAESDDSVTQREQGVVPASTNVMSRQMVRASLPDDDSPHGDRLAAKTFDTAILRITVASVPRGTLTFFVCHFYLLETKN